MEKIKVNYIQKALICTEFPFLALYFHKIALLLSNQTPEILIFHVYY
jgi:hypothetical protein